MDKQVNIYRSKGEWCYALWIDGECDHSDTLGCADEASESDARAEATAQFPDASVKRVEDC